MLCPLLCCGGRHVAALAHVVQDGIPLEVVDDHDGVVLLEDAAVVQVGLERRRGEALDGSGSNLFRVNPWQAIS